MPQGVVDFSAGMGDGILSTMSFGLIKGQSLRDSLGVDGGIDKCTGAYKSGVVTGAAATLATNAVGAIPKTLTHFTTEAGAAGIAQSGIKSSSAGLFGAGKYASSVGGYPKNPFVPPGFTIPVAINKTTGYVRAVPGTFVQPTAGGATQLVSMNAGYGVVANQNNLNCRCK